MRKWINLIEKADYVTTFRLSDSSYADGNWEVFRNLSRGDVTKIFHGEARMFLLPDGNVLFWNEGVLHNEVAHAIKVSEDYPHLCYDVRKRDEIWWNEIERYKLDHIWDRPELDFTDDENYYESRLRKDWEAVVSNPVLQRLCGRSMVVMGIDENYGCFEMDSAWIERKVQK